MNAIELLAETCPRTKGVSQAKRERDDRAVLDEEARRIRQRTISRADGPIIGGTRGRWLHVDNWDDGLLGVNPWALHFGGGRSRMLSVTRVGVDGDGRTWVQGDVLPRVKKEETVGARVSTADIECKKVLSMKVTQIKL